MFRFYGAPAPKDIAFAAYGPRASDKIVKGLMERMLPCIIDESQIPLGYCNQCFSTRLQARYRWERWGMGEDTEHRLRPNQQEGGFRCGIRYG